MRSICSVDTTIHKKSIKLKNSMTLLLLFALLKSYLSYKFVKAENWESNWLRFHLGDRPREFNLNELQGLIPAVGEMFS